MKLEKATMGDVALSLLIPGWGLMVGVIALIKSEFKRGFTMLALSLAVIAVFVALNA